MRTAVHPTPKPASWVGKRVLICEDNCLIAMTFASTLRDTGYEVVGPVHTAEAALAEAYRHLPDVALIDIGLSGAIDGISVAAELAPLGVPVVLLTGNYQRAGEEGRELAADILIKPVSDIAILRSSPPSFSRSKHEVNGDDPLNCWADNLV